MIPTDRVFCDTGFFYACLAQRDRYYHRAGELLEHCRDQRIRMFSTWDVVSETITLLTYRIHAQAAIQFLDTMKPALALIPTTHGVLSEAEGVSAPREGAPAFLLRRHFLCRRNNAPRQYSLPLF
jgi:predicted nucleic acid-binding protein